MRYLLIGIVAVIFSLGTVMVFSTNSAEVLDLELTKSVHLAPLKHLLYAFAGAALAFGVYRAGYQNFLRWTPPLLVVFTFLLVLTLLPITGKEVNGSKRWLNLPGFSFQPSEFVKILVLAFFVYKSTSLPLEKLSFKNFTKIALPATLPIFLILIEPNNGTCGVIVCALVALCFLVGIPLKFWAVPLIGFALAGAVFASQLPYVTARLKVYLDPELDIRGKGHQPYQAKIAAGSGGLWGKGPGNSWQKLSYLPEAQNDYIGAIYAEEFGFLGMAALIFLYMAFALGGFSLAFRACTPSAGYLAAALTFLISFQAFLNLGVVSGLLPSTGLNLPFFSQGGSSLVANFAALGLLQSIAWEKRAYG